ncbi:MAG: hypothetical protein K1X88_22715 [Nannocystaceae bacterium]|nr:hypothetical protein [Nannocystaceae bacterium]
MSPWPRVGVLAVALALGGCHPAWLPLLASQNPGEKTQVAAVPVEDGSQYVSVITKAPASPMAVRNRWRREAATACDGDYVVLAENAASQQTGAVTARRIHEGFVRCVSPEAQLAPQDKPVSDGGRSDTARTQAARRKRTRGRARAYTVAP